MGEIDEPEAGPGKAVVEVAAVALNPVELRVAAGRTPQRPQVPYVPGLEGTGTVGALLAAPTGGPGPVRERPARFGRQRRARRGGCRGRGDARRAAACCPDSLAAAAGVVGVTARLALQRAGFVPGERVVVLGRPEGSVRWRCS